MGSITVSEESVAMLESLASKIGEIKTEIDAQINSTIVIYDENKDSLGAHSSDIYALLEDMKTIEEDASKVMNLLSLKISKACMIRKSHIENNRYKSGSSASTSLEVAGFKKDVEGFRGTLDIGSGASGITQLSGAHKEVQKKEGMGYESHHIPSKAALQEFGVNTDEWPTIALTKEDHAKTDSYRGKQRKTTKSVFDGKTSDTYKKETIDMIDRPGGFFELVRDEILNIKEACGDKYDGAIDDYLKNIEEYVSKHGIPQKTNKK